MSFHWDWIICYKAWQKAKRKSRQSSGEMWFVILQFMKTNTNKSSGHVTFITNSQYGFWVQCQKLPWKYNVMEERHVSAQLTGISCLGMYLSHRLITVHCSTYISPGVYNRLNRFLESSWEKETTKNHT